MRWQGDLAEGAGVAASAAVVVCPLAPPMPWARRRACTRRDGRHPQAKGRRKGRGGDQRGSTQRQTRAWRARRQRVRERASERDNMQRDIQGKHRERERSRMQGFTAHGTTFRSQPSLGLPTGQELRCGLTGRLSPCLLPHSRERRRARATARLMPHTAPSALLALVPLLPRIAGTPCPCHARWRRKETARGWGQETFASRRIASRPPSRRRPGRGGQDRTAPATGAARTGPRARRCPAPPMSGASRPHKRAAPRLSSGERNVARNASVISKKKTFLFRAPGYPWWYAARRQNAHSSATREATPANPGRPGRPSRWQGRPPVVSIIPCRAFPRQTPNAAKLRPHILSHTPELRGIKRSHRRRGRVCVCVSPGCFAHPKTRAFWLGGGSEGRRAQGQ